MSKGKKKAGKKPTGKKKAPPPTSEEIEAAKKAAQQKLDKQIAEDQAVLDKQLEGKSDAYKDEVFRQISKNCSNSTMADGKITLGCPLPRKMQYCMPTDDATKSELSNAASESLKDDETCVDGQFVSKAEGGSHRTPYVPWGPFASSKPTAEQKKAGKTPDPKFTSGNSSGVTVGTGVDLGAITDKKAYLTRLEAAGVSKQTRDKLEPLLGKKREDACQALREATKDGPLVLPPEDVEKIDVDAMKTRVPSLKSQFKSAKKKRVAGLKAQIAKEKKKKKPDQQKIDALQSQADGTQDFGDLSCADQTVLFSTLYHEGSINKPHMKDYVNALIDGDADAADQALANKGSNGNPLLASRGKQERKYRTDKLAPPDHAGEGEK